MAMGLVGVMASFPGVGNWWKLRASSSVKVRFLASLIWAAFPWSRGRTGPERRATYRWPADGTTSQGPQGIDPQDPVAGHGVSVSAPEARQ